MGWDAPTVTAGERAWLPLAGRHGHGRREAHSTRSCASMHADSDSSRAAARLAVRRQRRAATATAAAAAAGAGAVGRVLLLLQAGQGRAGQGRAVRRGNTSHPPTLRIPLRLGLCICHCDIVATLEESTRKGELSTFPAAKAQATQRSALRCAAQLSSPPPPPSPPLSPLSLSLSLFLSLLLVSSSISRHTAYSRSSCCIPSLGFFHSTRLEQKARTIAFFQLSLHSNRLYRPDALDQTRLLYLRLARPCFVCLAPLHILSIVSEISARPARGAWHPQPQPQPPPPPSCPFHSLAAPLASDTTLTWTPRLSPNPSHRRGESLLIHSSAFVAFLPPTRSQPTATPAPPTHAYPLPNLLPPQSPPSSVIESPGPVAFPFATTAATTTTNLTHPL